MSRLANWLYNNFSYTIIRRSVLHDYKLIQKTRDILGHYKIDLVLDIGANRGQYMAMLRREIGYRGRVISFEPVASNRQHLSQKFRCDSNWSLQPYALGSKDTELAINIMDVDLFSSFLSPADELPDKFKAENRVKRTEIVPVRTLASLFKQGQIPADKNIFAKIDTQGFDLEVMKGSAEYLQQFCAVQTELSYHQLYKNMPTWREVTGFMYDAGFVLAGIYEVCSESTRLLEADAVFVRP